MRRLIVVLSCFFFSVNASIEAADTSTENPSQVLNEVTKPIAPSWTLTDTYGNEVASTDFQNAKLTVVMFLGTECPLAKQYVLRISELKSRFSDQDVRFVGIDSNEQDSLQELAAFQRKHNIDWPLLKDPDQKVADGFQATRTPEVFVVQSQTQIIYRGRVDDQFGIGSAKPAPEQQYLKDAIESALSDSPVRIHHTQPVGCLIGRKRHRDQPDTDAQALATVSYSKDIAPLLQRHCVSCHREGEIGPMALDNYADVAAWADMILEVMHDGRMPPWHANPKHGKFVNDRRLTEDEKALLNSWVAQGAVEGNPKDLPEPYAYVPGWQFERAPDAVVEMAKKPFEVPATGVVDYQYFSVDPGFTEDKWIEAYEIQPSNRAVVHHVLVFAIEKNHKGGLGGERSYLAGYVPGSRVMPFPKGMAKKIEAGSRLIFQVHYTPVGTTQTDLSRIGFLFADPDKITHEVKTTSALNPQINIPPNESNYTTSALLPEELPECQLLSMSPHMHMRGKSFRYELISKDRRKEILLDVPKYDFAWQTAYCVDGVKMIEKGSRVRCYAAFDNSSNNLSNPDPSKRVHWGDQTTDEMMIGYFDIAVRRQ